LSTAITNLYDTAAKILPKAILDMIPLANGTPDGYDAFIAKADAIEAKYGKANVRIAFSLLSNVDNWRSSTRLTTETRRSCETFITKTSVKSYRIDKYFFDLGNYFSFTHWLDMHRSDLREIKSRAIRSMSKYMSADLDLPLRDTKNFSVTITPASQVAKWFNQGNRSISHKDLYCVSEADLPKITKVYGS
jgi:hypothetical protein